MVEGIDKKIEDENTVNDETLPMDNIKKHSYKEAMDALDIVQSYVKSHQMKIETINAVGKVGFDIQSHYMKKPKCTKSITSYFSK